MPSCTRHAAPELDAILGDRFDVLDDGFVRVVDYLGSDQAVVQAARVSYGAGTRKVQEDRGLIRYLMRHRHTTPFEMCDIKLHLRVPMDCWRQWIRHRTASVNEYSTRYSLAIDAAQSTPEHAWRRQAGHNRQGSAGWIDPAQGAQLSQREQEVQALSRAVYLERIEAGVAREQARKDLPLATYTEAYWKVNLHNLLHFIELRMEPAAQVEIRAYAEVIGTQIVQRWMPLTWEAFADYRIHGMSLSRLETDLLGRMLCGETDLPAALQALGWSTPAADGGMKLQREAREFAGKLRRMGVDPNWDSCPMTDSRHGS